MERRKSRRVLMSLQASWGTSARLQPAVVINGSAQGCFLQTQADEPGDDLVRLVIRLPQGEAVQLWGEVTYYLPTVGFGLQFVEGAEGGDPGLEKWAEYVRVAELNADAGKGAPAGAEQGPSRGPAGASLLSGSPRPAPPHSR
jgi:hypothetical protein